MVEHRKTGHKMTRHKTQDCSLIKVRWTNGGPTDKSLTNILGWTEAWWMSLDRQTSMGGRKSAMWRPTSWCHRPLLSFVMMADGNTVLPHCYRRYKLLGCVATPLWRKCEVATHTPENGTWESFGILKNSELDCRGQNTLHWSVHYTVGKVSECRCPKWPCMSHLDMCNTSYGRKKGQESNWQFDPPTTKSRESTQSRCVQVECDTYWTALKESYKFASDLVPIGGRSEKLWTPKVPGVQTGTVSRLHFGSPGKKCYSDVRAAERCREYYMREGGGFPRVWAVVSKVNPRLPVTCPNTKSV